MVDLPEFLRPNQQMMLAGTDSNYHADPRALPYTWAANERKRWAAEDYTKLVRQQNAVAQALAGRALEVERQKAAAGVFTASGPHNPNYASQMGGVMGQMGMNLPYGPEQQANASVYGQGMALDKLFGANKQAADMAKALAEAGQVSKGPINLGALGAGSTAGFESDPEYLKSDSLKAKTALQALENQGRVAAAAAGNSGSGEAGSYNITGSIVPGMLPEISGKKVPAGQVENVARNIMTLQDKLRGGGSSTPGPSTKGITPAQANKFNEIAQKEKGRIRELGVDPNTKYYGLETTRGGQRVKIYISPDGTPHEQPVSR